MPAGGRVRRAGRHKADVLPVGFFMVGERRPVSLKCSAWWSVWVRLASPPRVQRRGERVCCHMRPAVRCAPPAQGGCVATLLPTPCHPARWLGVRVSGSCPHPAGRHDIPGHGRSGACGAACSAAPCACLRGSCVGGGRSAVPQQYSLDLASTLLGPPVTSFASAGGPTVFS